MRKVPHQWTKLVWQGHFVLSWSHRTISINMKPLNLWFKLCLSILITEKVLKITLRSFKGMWWKINCVTSRSMEKKAKILYFIAHFGNLRWCCRFQIWMKDYILTHNFKNYFIFNKFSVKPGLWHKNWYFLEKHPYSSCLWCWTILYIVWAIKGHQCNQRGNLMSTRCTLVTSSWS